MYVCIYTYMCYGNLWHIFSGILFWNSIMACYRASDALSGILSGIYADILSDMGTELWSWRLRSGSAHWDLQLAGWGGGMEEEEWRRRGSMTLIKSRDPHLGSGERHPRTIQMWIVWFHGETYCSPCFEPEVDSTNWWSTSTSEVEASFTWIWIPSQWNEVGSWMLILPRNRVNMCVNIF